MKERKHYNAQTLLAAVTRLAKRVETFFRVSTPSSRKKLGKLAEHVILVMSVITVLGALLWASVDKPCDNGCGAKVPDPSASHLSQCARCDQSIFNCPDLIHPHKAECPVCQQFYWICWESEALLHGEFCQFSRKRSQPYLRLSPADEKQIDR